VISGPVPSPGMRVMLWGMGILSLAGVAPLMIANAPSNTIGLR